MNTYKVTIYSQLDEQYLISFLIQALSGDEARTQVRKTYKKETVSIQAM